jgi:predicted nucleic acid-binding protein
MTVALIDTTVIVHLLRRYAPAHDWYGSQAQRLSITSVTWLEVMSGAPNKADQTRYKILLGQFELLYLTVANQRWAMEQLERFQFSHHIGMDDCLIASVAYRLQLPLYTHNLKDMSPLIGALAIQPYL